MFSSKQKNVCRQQASSASKLDYSLLLLSEPLTHECVKRKRFEKAGIIFNSLKNMNPATLKPAANTAALRHIESLAKLMDSRFRFPGTNIRFGLDALIGLIPGAGDLSTFAVSSYMLYIMAQNGASGYVLARMILNVLMDGIIGSIPIVGDLFDIGFKANMRNLRLMQEHYQEGRHGGSAWKVIVPVLLIMLILLVALLWLAWKMAAALWNWLF
jgi:hypothetical protein